MSTRAKQICLLILAQTACVGVGLWMQQRHTAFSVHGAFEEHVRDQIELSASKIARRLGQQTLPDLVPSGPGVEQVRAILERARPSRAGVVIADGLRRVLVHLPDGDRAEAVRLSSGMPISWDPSPEEAQRGSDLMPGTLNMPDGPHIAVCNPLKAGQGYVLVHRPVATIESEAAALTRSFPAIMGMALFWTIALLTIMAFVVLGWIHERADAQRARSTSDVLRQAQNLVRTRDAVILGLANLAESRDDETGEHLDRITAYSTTLASALRGHPKYIDQVTPAFVRLIGISAALHDIGKVGIEDKILLKPGSLNAVERARMEAHTLIGGGCLREIEQRLGTSNFMQMARQIAFAHHERWDGSGYPKGLAGNDIPLAARIVAIADVYDALSSRRVYKPAFPHEKCVEIIRDDAGKQFDPDLVEIWLTVEAKFRDIACRYAASTQTAIGAAVPDSAPSPQAHDDQTPSWSAHPLEEAAEAIRELSALR